MLTRLFTLKSYLDAKLGQRGAAMVEYALVLAFVAIIAAVFLNDGTLGDKITSIITKLTNIVSNTEAKVPGSGS